MSKKKKKNEKLLIKSHQNNESCRIFIAIVSTLFDHSDALNMCNKIYIYMYYKQTMQYNDGYNKIENISNQKLVKLHAILLQTWVILDFGTIIIFKILIKIWFAYKLV